MRDFVFGIALAVLGAGSASAATLTADIELEYFNSGANASFATGVYGGTVSSYPYALPDTSNARDGSTNTFISLPTGSFITLGFSGGFVVDGAGDDIFVTETFGANELADVYVSTDKINFTFLGTAGAGGTETFDLASIGYTSAVNAVKIVGKDLGGGSPGFDLALVQGLEGSVVLNPVPLPASALLLFGGLLGLGALRRLS